MKKSSQSKLPYSDFLTQELPLLKTLNNESAPLVIDLFAGCGGLSLGFEMVGFKTIGYEMSRDACQTYNHNLQRECYQVTLTRNPDLLEAEIIIGGPPCQPFSKGGYQLGLNDRRDGFPIFLDAVQRYHPKIALFENVPGILSRNQAYFDEIVKILLRLGYVVEWEILDAANYGVPQHRKRLFCVAHQGNWKWPPKTHFYSPYTAGEALAELALTIPRDAKFLTPNQEKYIQKYEQASKCINPRDIKLHEPARTVTCRNLSAPTGDMLRICLPDGRRRRLTVREGARLQGFPDWFQFYGSQGRQCEQIGNAVPPILAKVLARSVKDCLKTGEVDRNQYQLSFNDRPQQLSLNFNIVETNKEINYSQNISLEPEKLWNQK